MIEQLLRFCTALRFLTIIPISWGRDEDGGRFSQSVLYFPVVGLLIGLPGVALVYLLSSVLPHQVVVLLLILYLGIISGFLHLDGLADSGDGFFCARPMKDRLQIMKDSRSGPMGVLVLFFVLLFKFTAFSSLSSSELLFAVLLITCGGRVTILLSMANLPYAREEGGLGELFYSEKIKTAAIVGSVLFFIICVVILDLQKAMLLLIMFFIVNYILVVMQKRMAGGATGDTLGGACEISEAIIGVTLSSLYYIY